MRKILIPISAFILGYFSSTREKAIYLPSSLNQTYTIKSPTLISRPTGLTLESSIINLKEQKSRLEKQIEEHESLLRLYPNFEPFDFDIELPYGHTIVDRYNNNPIYFTQPKAINDLIQLLIDIKDGYTNPNELHRTKITRKGNTYLINYQGRPYDEPPFTNGFEINLTVSSSNLQIKTKPRLGSSPTIYYFSDNNSSILSIGGVKVKHEKLFHNFSRIQYLN